MRVKTKLVSIAVSIMLAAGMCPAAALAEIPQQVPSSPGLRAQSAGAAASGTWGTCPWEISADGTLTVRPGEGADTGGTSPWRDYAPSVKHVVFAQEGGAKVMAPPQSDYLLGGMSQVTSADLSGLDTSNATSAGGMFLDCSSLTSLDLSNLDTSKVTSMNAMFYGCGALASLDVSGFDTSNVVNTSWMFDECASLDSLDVSGFDTSNAWYMGGMFYGCSSLTALDVSGFDTSNAIDVRDMFENCSSLTSLDLSSFDTSGGPIMYAMFCGCESLASLDLSSFDTSKVDRLDYMFYGCSSLTSLNVSGLDTSSVTNMARMFGGCASLPSLDVSGFDTSNVTDMRGMFESWSPSALTSLDLSSFDTSHVGDMSSMFGGCGSLESISVGDSWSTGSVTRSSGMFAGCASLVGGNGTAFDPDHTDAAYARIDEDGAPGYLTSISGAGGSNVKWTPVTFGVTFPLDGERWTSMRIKWGFDLFDSSPIGGVYTTGYDNRLAIASAVLSEAAYSEDLSYRVFGELGVRDVFRAEKYGDHLMNQPATCMGYTKASVGGEEKNLYVVAIRGTLDAEDIGTDAGAWMQAFEPSASYVKNRFDAFVDYVAAERPESKGLDNVVLVTGHSLGGACAGRLTELLSADSRFPPERTFCYTFAAANWTYSHTDRYYKNIHNVVNGDDVVPMQNISAASRNGVDIRFYPDQVPGFKNKFAYVTNGRDFDNLASWDVLSTGGNLLDAAVMANHQMDAYMSYLLCEYGAEETWKYRIRCVRAVSVHCPVDVEVVDSYGETVAKIVDNEVISSSLRVQALAISDEKYLYALDDGDYSVRLTGSGDGAMRLSFDEINPETMEVTPVKEFSNVALADGKKMELPVAGDEQGAHVALYVLDDAGEAVSEVRGDGGEVPANTIRPAVDISAAAISVPAQTYTGKALTPTPTVVLGGRMLSAGEHYVVSYADNTNAGTASVTIRGLEAGGYSGEARATFPIAKAKSAMTATAKKPSLELTYSASRAQTITAADAYVVTGARRAVAFEKRSGDPAIAVGNGGEVTVGKGLAAGSYKLVVTVADSGDANHEGASREVALAIVVARASNPMTVKTTAKNVKFAKVRSKAQKAAPLSVKGAKGAKSFKVVKWVTKKAKRHIKVNAKTGKVTVKRGTPRGVYKFKVMVSAAGDANHKPASKTVKATVRVK